jgi:hypothetical protein
LIFLLDRKKFGNSYLLLFFYIFPSEDDKVGNGFEKSLFGIEGKFICLELLPVNLHP